MCHGIAGKGTISFHEAILKKKRKLLALENSVDPVCSLMNFLDFVICLLDIKMCEPEPDCGKAEPEHDQIQNEVIKIMDIPCGPIHAVQNQATPKNHYYQYQQLGKQVVPVFCIFICWFFHDG